jgi:sigma-B regulation protein RsbU (phosphoserine phosphatase)
VLDLEKGTVAYSNGGHNPPFILRAAGGVDHLPGRGLPAGTLEEATYQTRELALQPGDVLFLYTDGVTEAMNAAGDLFTVPRLQAALEQGDRSAPVALMHDVLEAVRVFTGDAPQSDDLTALAVRYTGRAP